MWSYRHSVSRLYTVRRYDIYDIGPPYLWYNITIDILEFGGVEEEVQGGRMVFDVHWNPVANVVITLHKCYFRFCITTNHSVYFVYTCVCDVTTL